MLGFPEEIIRFPPRGNTSSQNGPKSQCLRHPQKDMYSWLKADPSPSRKGILPQCKAPASEKDPKTKPGNQSTPSDQSAQPSYGSIFQWGKPAQKRVMFPLKCPFLPCAGVMTILPSIAPREDCWANVSFRPPFSRLPNFWIASKGNRTETTILGGP